MSDIELIVVVLLFAINLMLAVIAWCLTTIDQSINDLRESNIAISATTHTLMKEHQSELQRARLRAR